jgi:hypothetical protein
MRGYSGSRCSIRYGRSLTPVSIRLLHDGSLTERPEVKAIDEALEKGDEVQSKPT